MGYARLEFGERHLDSVKNIERLVPVIWVFTEIEVYCEEDVTDSNVAVERKYEKPCTTDGG